MTEENYTHLDFPLNVFAQALYLQEGRVDYLHYGLFEVGESIEFTSARIAQQRATDLLFKYLPSSPCRILEVGMGLGTTTALLAEHGYSVTCISPDAQQIAIAQHRVPKTVKMECTTYEDFSAPNESYDVVLFQESAQYIPSLTLFNKAYDLLSKHGIVVILDEVGLQRTEKYSTYGLPLVHYIKNQASRCGFDWREQLDLSAKAAPTAEYLLWIIEKHKTALMLQLSLELPILDELLLTLQEYRQKYSDGHYGYTLLTFSKVETPPRWKITLIKHEDKQAIRTLFSEVFPPPTMSDELWEWKYGENRGLGTAAWLGERMVAHYGAIKRPISYFGQAKFAVQIADVMVDAKERSRLRRHGRGVFFQMAATFPEIYAGYGAPIELGYGFPTTQAMKVAEGLGLYASVGKLMELRWQTTSGKPHLWTRIRHLHFEQIEKNRKIINTLWSNMVVEFKDYLIGVRDWNYVHHRYFSHPHKQYELLLISQRFTGKALALAVIYRQNELCRLIDFIGDLKHIPETIKQVRRVAGIKGMKQVGVWITENFVSVFPQEEAELQDLDIAIPHSIWSQGVSPEQIKDKWWLMAGDTDFM